MSPNHPSIEEIKAYEETVKAYKIAVTLYSEKKTQQNTEIDLLKDPAVSGILNNKGLEATKIEGNNFNNHRVTKNEGASNEGASNERTSEAKPILFSNTLSTQRQQGKSDVTHQTSPPPSTPRNSPSNSA